MKHKKILIPAFILILIFTFFSVNTFRAQYQINKLKNTEVTRITLEHYDEIIEVDKEDQNFASIISLSSEVKVGIKYIGLPLYGMPITVNFYSEQELILTLAPGFGYTNVNEKRYYTRTSSRIYTNELASILGAYYGYIQ